MSGMCQSVAALPTWACGLLAQGRLAGLGERFRHGGGQMNWPPVLIVVAVLGIAVLVVWSVARHLNLKESGGYHNHRSLFRELCRAHGLGWMDRRLLVAVARRHGVVVPARLFIEPERLEPERLAGLPEAQRRRAAELCETLFGADAKGKS